MFFLNMFLNLFDWIHVVFFYVIDLLKFDFYIIITI